MTRKDFELIAEAIRTAKIPDGLHLFTSHAAAEAAIRQSIAFDFAVALRQTNPRFDVGRFERACGVTEYRVTGEYASSDHKHNFAPNYCTECGKSADS